jgi:hypothetical protein
LIDLQAEIMGEHISMDGDVFMKEQDEKGYENEEAMIASVSEELSKLFSQIL